MPGAGPWLPGRSARTRTLISVNLGEGYGSKGYYILQICQDNSLHLPVERSLYDVGQVGAHYVVVAGSDVADLDSAEHLDVEMLDERRRVDVLDAQPERVGPGQ